MRSSRLSFAFAPLVAASTLLACSSGPTPPPRYDRVLQLETAADQSGGIGLGDLDGDGNLDIVLAKGRHQPLVNRVLLGDGQGGIKTAFDLGTVADQSYSARLVDLDTDGDLDVVISNDTPSPKLVYLNDGHGQFAAPATYGKPEWSMRNATIADVNGDGLPDIIAAIRADPGANELCLNRGAGRFDADCIVLSDESSTTIAVADFDRDGYLDFLVPHRDGGQSHLYFGAKDADFAHLRRVPFGPAATQIRVAAARDFNGDGTVDVVTIDEQTATSIFFGNGDGTFGPAIPVGSATATPYALTVSDLNCDGKPDVIVGFIGARPIAYFNDGTAKNFTAVEFGDAEGTAYDIAVGDFDKDGRADIAIARSDATNVLYFGAGSGGRCSGQ